MTLKYEYRRAQSRDMARLGLTIWDGPVFGRILYYGPLAVGCGVFVPRNGAWRAYFQVQPKHLTRWLYRDAKHEIADFARSHNIPALLAERDNTFETSARFLTGLGFEPYDVEVDDDGNEKEVWRWRPSSVCSRPDCP